MATEQAIEEAIRHVRGLYDSGAPVFTRQGIRALAEQLEKIRAAGQPATVTVPSIDGRMVNLGVMGSPAGPEALLDPEGSLPVTGMMCDALPQWYSDEHGPLPPVKPDDDEKRLVRYGNSLLRLPRSMYSRGIMLLIVTAHQPAWRRSYTILPLAIC
jgi:hypothetical protein